MPNLPPRLKPWVLPPTNDVKEIVRAYESGMAGCWHDEESAEYVQSYGYRDADSVIQDHGFADAGKGKLSVPFVAITERYPNAFAGPAQQVGSCVADAVSVSILQTLCTEAMAGEPDPVSGYIETYPDVTKTAEKNRPVAMEPIYRHRGHRGHGWHCSAAVSIAVEKVGAVVRKDYGFVDLTEYNPKWASAQWKGAASEEEANAFDDNLVQDAVRVTEWEQFRDLTAAGFGIVTCGGESWSNKRDENAMSERTRVGWAHALHGNCLSDDRPETHRKFGGPLCGPSNTWGRWNTGPRRIPGTDLEMPHGTWIARWKDFRKREMYAIAGLNGWLREKLLDLSPGLR